MAWRLHLSSGMSNEIAEQLKERTLRFALQVMRLCRSLAAD
jgi:succinate dehydrogenase hydrophobic anchor subunit